MYVFVYVYVYVYVSLFYANAARRDAVVFHVFFFAAFILFGGCLGGGGVNNIVSASFCTCYFMSHVNIHYVNILHPNTQYALMSSFYVSKDYVIILQSCFGRRWSRSSVKSTWPQCHLVCRWESCMEAGMEGGIEFHDVKHVCLNSLVQFAHVQGTLWKLAHRCWIGNGDLWKITTCLKL